MTSLELLMTLGVGVTEEAAATLLEYNKAHDLNLLKRLKFDLQQRELELLNSGTKIGYEARTINTNLFYIEGLIEQLIESEKVKE